MGLATHLALLIVNVVKDTKDLNHEALRLTAAQHSADDVANLLLLIGVPLTPIARNEGESDDDFTKRSIEYYAPMVASFLPALDHAKKLAAEKLAAAKTLRAGKKARGKQPASGGVPHSQIAQ